MGRWQRVLYHPNLPLGKDGKRVTACKEHIELSKLAAKEAMVLLKNEKEVLPLKKGARVVLFGKGCVDYVKGGGGSGDVTISYQTNLYQGFLQLSDIVSVYQPLAAFYEKEVEKQYASGTEQGMTTEPEVPQELLKKAAYFTDTAIISICRFSGEGWDRKDDFYLTKEEKDMIEQVKAVFEKIIVVLNVGGMVDTGWFYEDEKIDSVLLAWQCGMEGGSAAAELLCGLGNPSGKLPDTFASRLEDYPSTVGFHESDDYVDYTEDIYVGYRYFETIRGADEKVNYPFGYGLSYTTFESSVTHVEQQKERIQLRIKVENTGKYAGKEVIQVYVEAPQGLLGKARKVLVCFEKTRLLQPGEVQSLSFDFSLADFASYDDTGKIQQSAYLLEAGVYHLYVGNSVRHTKKLEEEIKLEETILVEQLSKKLAPTSLKERMLADGSMELLPLENANDPDACGLEFEKKEPLDGLTPAGRRVEPYCLWKEGHKPGIHTFDEVAEGMYSLDDFVRQMTEEELAHLLGGQPNAGVANTFGIGNMPEYRIPNVMTADGPAGLRIAPECGIYTTAWPCSTALAATWNCSLVCEVGAAGAREVKENNIGIWLTPAVNIHRNPLCGRNFEYYSEDPLLAGSMAGAMVEGIQSEHIAATVKHFALNNKETNRKNSDSRVSERAAREIYLKPFEYIVKTKQPMAIMTSYNIINGHRASENQELIQGILREEWGFEGMVTSDWWTFGEHYKEAKAGNDVKMAIGFPERLLEAKEKGLISREEMEACAKHILGLILKLD